MPVVINDVTTTVEPTPEGAPPNQPAPQGAPPQPLTVQQLQILTRQAAERKLRTLAY